MSDPGDVVAAADVVVLLSRAEGVPQLLIKAAAVGSPFVAYEVDGTGDLLGLGATGTVVAAGDMDAAVAAVEALLASGRRGAPIDRTAWSPAAIAAGYRAVVVEALAGRPERALVA